MYKSNITASVALALTSMACSSVFADDESMSNKNLLVVTANRVEQNINDTLADVEVISREDIERIQPRSILDLLVNLSGIDFVQSGGHAQNASVFVRGTSASQVLVLVDGIRVGSATLGQKAVADIPVTQIERIEIVKGPRAAIWGSDAIGGVIQIFTRRLGAGEYRVALNAGSNNTYEIDTSVGIGGEKFSNTFTYSKKQSDGFDVQAGFQPDDDGYDSDSLAIRGEYVLSDESLIDYVIQRDRGEVEFDSSFGGDISHFKNHFWNLRYSHEAGQWLNQLALKNSRDRTYTSQSGAPSGVVSIFETRREQFSYLTRSRLSDALTVSGGVEYYEDNIEPTSLDYPVKKRDTKGAHISVNYVADKFLSDIAVRYDDVELVASESTINASFGYRLSEQHLLSLNYGEGFKAPTFNQLYFPGFGNDALKFETSDNLELLYKGNFKSSRLSVSIYESQIDNLIQFAGATSENIGEADISGIDFSYELWHGSYTHKITADNIRSEDGATGEQLIRRAKNHFGYQLSYGDDAFEWFAQVQYVGERDDLDFSAFPALPVTLDSFVRVNLGIGYSINDKWKAQLKINDLFDEAPVQVFSYNPVEREVYLTISHIGLF